MTIHTDFSEVLEAHAFTLHQRMHPCSASPCVTAPFLFQLTWTGWIPTTMKVRALVSCLSSTETAPPPIFISSTCRPTSQSLCQAVCNSLTLSSPQKSIPLLIIHPNSSSLLLGGPSPGLPHKDSEFDARCKSKRPDGQILQG